MRLIKKTGTKVVHKNVSQGFNQIGRSESKKITKPLHNIKVASFYEKIASS